MEPKINAPDDVVTEIARPDETRELVFHDLKDTLCERVEATERVFEPVLLLIRVDEDMIRELLPEADRENDAALIDFDAWLTGLTLAVDPMRDEDE